LDLDGALSPGLAAAEDLRVPDQVRDLVFLEEELDALVELGGDLARAADDPVPIQSDRAVELDPPELGLAELLDQLGVGEQGLAGDAPPVQAPAPELGPLDAGDVHAQLRGTDGADIPGGAAADDDEVEVAGGSGGGGHGEVPLRPGRGRGEA